MAGDTVERDAALSLARIMPRLQADFAGQVDAIEWGHFRARLEAQFPRLFRLLLHLYGKQYDFFYHLESTIHTAARMWIARSPEMKELDRERERNPHWYLSEQMMGGVCYVDLFAGDLKGLREKIPYLKELGLTYLHLMPLFLSPQGDNDGGYAVSSYRAVNPALGTMQQLSELAAELRRNGISLMLDFVFNHTSDEHDWAARAISGDPEHMAFYFMFPDRTMPDAYERTLREIFPGVRPGSFTYVPEVGRWVWTTFNSYQWDLNYSNPQVFTRMAEEMLFLSNAGAEVLRLDALAFIWKELGTSCENLPEAHMLVQAFNCIARIAAPSLIFQSEAIVHPDEVNRYISVGECQLSYNPLLMALEWESLATREVKLLHASMSHRFQIDPRCAWVNYVRSHDDIGWTFDDGDAIRLGINGYNHRRFLNSFYMGRFEGSVARGLPFQENPRTGDARICGTCASLAGVEKGVVEGDEEAVEMGIRRVLLLYSVALSMGGIPLLYFGDEIGTLNDYSFRSDPAKANDNRWVHRPVTDWEKVARRNDPGTLEGRVFGGLKRLIDARKSCPALAGGHTDMVDSGNGHVYAYVRQHDSSRVLVLANFSEYEQRVAANELRLYGLGYSFRDAITGEAISLEEDLVLEPYRFVWLVTG